MTWVPLRHGETIASNEKQHAVKMTGKHSRSWTLHHFVAADSF